MADATRDKTTAGGGRSRAKYARYVGQALLYALFAIVVGYFSTSPAYRYLEPNQGLLRLSFKHPGKTKAECRKRTAEELAKLQPQFRTDMDCPRERSPVRVRVELDGEPLYDEAFPPAGLSRDGASSGYRRLPIAAGPHTLRVQFNDDVRVQGFNFERAARVEVKPGQVVLIDFNPEQGGVIIR
ncbi:MAG: hypothetical protein WCA12_04810 [Burkholderiales bacterium]